MLDVCLLGSGGSMPIPERYLTSLLLSYNGKMILVDCGEGTQVSMRLLGWGFKAIDAICLTHYHGDHVIGLPGLLLTIGNAGRTEPLTIVGPPGLQQVIKGLLVVAPFLPYEVQVVELELYPTAMELAGMQIHVIPVAHTVPCLAYGFEIKRGSKFLAEQAKQLQIPVRFWKALQHGAAVEHEGRTFTPEDVLGPERRGIRIHYCTDSRPLPEIADFIQDSDLFICEGMYGEEDKLPNAISHGHMLFREAAKLAQDGHAKELWLTHFSPSMMHPEQYLKQAQDVFPNTRLGQDRMIAHLTFLPE